jgi:hypothetical protein|nr:MAG TPA: hypothetical protein [Caudoviricetes sp.]
MEANVFIKTEECEACIKEIEEALEEYKECVDELKKLETAQEGGATDGNAMHD